MPRNRRAEPAGRHRRSPTPRAEDMLRRREAELADLFENASVGLLLVSPEGIVLRANPAFLSTVGARARRVLNHALAAWVPEDGDLREMLARLARRETLHNHATELRTVRGAPRYVLIDADGQWERGRLLQSRWFVRDISRRRQLERDILEISDRERRAFAQELHDGMGQQLGGIAYLAGVLHEALAEKHWPEAAAAERIARLARQSLHDARRMARGLSPLREAPEGLGEALRDLAAQTAALPGVRCRLRGTPGILVPDTVTASHLFRIAQEAVSNALRHGQARSIDIRLRLAKRRMHLTVLDDGDGVRTPCPSRVGLGVRIMHYRANLIGGRLTIKPRRGRGTIVSCAVPWTPPTPTKTRR